MASRMRRIAIFLVVSILFAAVFGILKKYDEKLFTEWVMAYESGDDLYARKIANKMNFIDTWGSAYYLSHMDVSDSIRLNGGARNAKLSDALARLEAARFSLPGADRRHVVMLKASISAMLGDRNRAVKYAAEACKLNKPMAIEECLNGPFSFDDPQGYRWMALQYYENTTLYNFIGNGDKTRSKFYEAIALKYFDVEQARQLRDELIHEGRFSAEMETMYCSTSSPIDVAACK